MLSVTDKNKNEANDPPFIDQKSTYTVIIFRNIHNGIIILIHYCIKSDNFAFMISHAGPGSDLNDLNLFRIYNIYCDGEVIM